MKKIFLIIPVMLIACVPPSYIFYLKEQKTFMEVCDKTFNNTSCHYKKISDENKSLPFIEYSSDGRYTYFTNGKITIRIRKNPFLRYPSHTWFDFISIPDYTPEETRRSIEEKMQIETKKREDKKKNFLSQSEEKIKLELSSGLPKETNHRKLLEEFYKIKKSIEKDEFETTEVYEKRKKKITDRLFKNFRKIYIYSNLDTSYDADKQVMSVKTALNTGLLDSLHLINFHLKSEYMYIFESFLKDFDEYTGQNALGAKVGVTDISSDSIIYSANKTNSNLEKKINIYNIDAEKARRIKKHSKLLISAHFKNDVFSFLDYHLKPTFSNALEVKARGVMTYIDIDYACILDIEQRKCVYIFDTRPEE